MIVDEEQRFGVANKERLKEIRKNVDALALSATPIPRTLHMSLVGLRDMSLIETPPRDRLAIQTVVAPFNEELVAPPLKTNSPAKARSTSFTTASKSIYSLATLVTSSSPKPASSLPTAKWAKKNSKVSCSNSFRDEADVLVATTIVENGLDIPRANTMLINRSDRLGLAELYQLRGRVGRSHQRAYAYLLVPAPELPSPTLPANASPP